MRTLPGPAGNISRERKYGKGKVASDSLEALVSVAGFEEEWGDLSPSGVRARCNHLGLKLKVAREGQGQCYPHGEL